MKTMQIETPETIMQFLDYLMRMQKRYKEIYLTGEVCETDEEGNDYYANYMCMSHTQAASWVWKYALSKGHGTDLSFYAETEEEEEVVIARVEIWDNVTTVEIPDNMWDDYDWRL